MKLINKPPGNEWQEIIKRPYFDGTAVTSTVQMILNAVKQHGDEALWSFTKKFDGVELKSFTVAKEEFDTAEAKLSGDLIAAIDQAFENIERFHKSQVVTEPPVQISAGIMCWRKSVGIEKVGLYIPGGTAPLFSTVLMLGIPARLAGCAEIILCTPAGANGEVDPAVLYAARRVGVNKVFKIGGAQAIAAMAFGTETVPPVYKIFGPGNQYVTVAKQLIQLEGVAIDMPAGPSEVCVIADDTANPAFVAADLLSQAEHGPDSQVLLISTSEAWAEKCIEETTRQVQNLPRKEFASASLEGSKAVIVSSIEEAISLANAYAAEHLIINCAEARTVADKITNAGSIFIGPYSPETAGDYASGTNHTLPTNGFARVFSGVSIDSFIKKITVQELSREGLEGISKTVIDMANAEGLQAHAAAISIRLQQQ